MHHDPEVTGEPGLVEQPLQAEVPVRHDGELQAECLQALERREHSREDLEVERAHVGGCELIQVEVGVDRLEEDTGALPLQSR